MKTKEFIDTLKKHPDLPLKFEYMQGRFVRSDFHITEIKNVSFDTVDCGGIRNQWDETHVQLWENEMVEAHHKVDSNKALKIFQVVEEVRPTFQETEIKFEYGNNDFHTAVLAVGEIILTEDTLLIKLFETSTTCKAKDRANTDDEKANACCGTPKPKVKVSLKSLNEKVEPCCNPESGCC